MRNYRELPEEIMLDIMRRVPAKSAGLCRCVSKPWRALLSQPDFIKTHLQVTKINSLESLAVISQTRCEPVYYYAPLNNAHQVFDEITLSLTKLSLLSVNHIYGSCDGLLLALTYDDKMVAMNPITREIRQVPPSPLALPEASLLYGFGYDSTTDDYKIVIISSLHTLDKDLNINPETIYDVYSLKTGSWKRFENPPYYYNVFGTARGVCVGGCLHWLDDSPTQDKLVIVAFDLVDRMFREVPLPSSILDNLEGYYRDCVFDYVLGVLKGCLCMYAYEQGEVWVMKEYRVSESWTKLAVNQPRASFECFLSDQEQLVMEFVDGKRVLWNLKQGTWKKIVFNGFSGCLENHRVVATFVESLVSPHGRV